MKDGDFEVGTMSFPLLRAMREFQAFEFDYEERNNEKRILLLKMRGKR